MKPTPVRPTPRQRGRHRRLRTPLGVIVDDHLPVVDRRSQARRGGCRAPDAHVGDEPVGDDAERKTSLLSTIASRSAAAASAETVRCGSKI
jgi:hypothetical protein